MEFSVRKAEPADQDGIWSVLQDGIARRKRDGSNQWQDGYPNPEVVQKDVEKGVGYVLLNSGNRVVGYMVILVNDEPAYADIKGKWLSEGDFIALHRIAIAEDHAGRGLSHRLLEFAEDFARERNIRSIKADTNHDNAAMARMFGKLGYEYCGTVFVNDGLRNAYEKLL